MEGKASPGVRDRVGIAVAAFVAFVALAAVPSAQASGVAYSSTFDAGNEGWYSSDGTTFTPAMWQASGGNPDGYIAGVSHSGFARLQSVPTAAGTTWPAANALGDYGGTLGADIRFLYSSTATETDTTIGFVSLNSSVVPCQDFGPTTPDWSTDTVTLDVGDLFSCVAYGRRLTRPQLTAALAGFAGIVVSAGDYESVAATVELDNAELGAPQTAVTPPTGAVARVLTLGYRRGKFRGTLTSAYDFSCASKMKVTVYRSARRPVKVGTVTTSVPDHAKVKAPTTFTLGVRAARKGTYYASAAKTKSGLDGNTCSGAKSPRVRVP